MLRETYTVVWRSKDPLLTSIKSEIKTSLKLLSNKIQQRKLSLSFKNQIVPWHHLTLTVK